MELSGQANKSAQKSRDDFLAKEKQSVTDEANSAKDQADSIAKEATTHEAQDKSVKDEAETVKEGEKDFLENSIFSDENCKRVISAHNPFSKDYKKQKTQGSAINDRM